MFCHVCTPYCVQHLSPPRNVCAQLLQVRVQSPVSQSPLLQWCSSLYCSSSGFTAGTCTSRIVWYVGARLVFCRCVSARLLLLQVCHYLSSSTVGTLVFVWFYYRYVESVRLYDRYVSACLALLQLRQCLSSPAAGKIVFVRFYCRYARTLYVSAQLVLLLVYNLYIQSCLFRAIVASGTCRMHYTVCLYFTYVYVHTRIRPYH